MNSSVIGKIEKAHRYAREHDRFRFSNLSVEVAGDNGSHEVSLVDNRWSCGCDFFAGWRVCSHTMAVEQLLDGMLPKEVIGQEFAQPAAR